jgi:sister-chromatid-cohesion protein PDS5
MAAQIRANLKAPPMPTKAAQNGRGRANPESQATPAASQRITDVPYYAEYYYLLENLATIKSVVLCLDVPDWEGIVTSFFEGFVEIVR